MAIPFIFFIKAEIRKIDEREKGNQRMVPKTEPFEVHHEDDSDPDGDKLSRNWYQLQPEPKLFDVTFIYNQPSIVQRNKSQNGVNTSLFKQSIHPDMPTNNANNQKE